MTATRIEGFVEDDFELVRSAFAENFTERGDVGAAVAVYLDGEPVVDLWGGVTLEDGERNGSWKRDTLVCMFAVNKTVTALCAHRLADQGRLDYQMPVAHYWPEFAQAGKERITVHQLMSGMAALLYPDEVPDGMVFDWEEMVAGLAKTEPAWPPGTRSVYHTSTYGHLVGELIRRVSGQMPDEYFRAEMAEPLGIDYWFTVPEPERHRVSEVMRHPDSAAAIMAEGTMKALVRAWRIAPQPDVAGLVNDPRYAHELMPSAWGKGNARAVGKLFAALAMGGALDEYEIMSRETLQKATTLQWEGPDIPGSPREIRYAMGVLLNSSPYFPLGPNPEAFGAHGLGFADPDRRLAFSYCTNFMAAGLGVGAPCRALIDAAFASIGESQRGGRSA